ncbi:V-ATPase V1 sector subunit E [Taxawa tesnikishii (nom. ined.)]|nr:V-ATPase V1 sector subunit E [Dothideales sp. JES 119]
MSQSHGMSDDQVASELRKMTAFIRQEALEKAREIQLKADEEFAIEKSNLVRQETSSIDSSYEKKFKQAGMSQQITKSTLANKVRLRLLSARQQLLDELFEDAGKKLPDYTQDEGKYQSILKNLLLEGVYAMNEKKVIVRCRQKDQEIVGKAADEAKAEYKEKLGGREVEIAIDEKERLPEESAGGVTILNGSGKIDINNTFEERLHLLESDALPSIRTTLFGENKNRKFKD